MLSMLASLALAAEPLAFVICAPGYPGTTEEARPAMDAFAAALAARAGWPAGSIVGAYFGSAKAGEERLSKPDAGIAMLALPLYLEEAERLKLQPRLVAVQSGAAATEVWSLVAKKGRVTGPASLEGWRIVSLAGYSPRFVRVTALSGWGTLPPKVEIAQSGQVLSWLRKAVGGENVALLLDGAQSAALPTLPFAAELEVVTRSPPLPSGVVATVGKKLAAGRWEALEKALLSLRDAPDGAAALDGIRLQGFAPLEASTLAAARKSFGAGDK